MRIRQIVIATIEITEAHISEPEDGRVQNICSKFKLLIRLCLRAIIKYFVTLGTISYQSYCYLNFVRRLLIH